MQNTPAHKLPRWFSFAIAAVFFGHFIIITVYHFSRHILPEKLWHYTEHYVSPWFYQYFMAFAPEPPMDSKRFVYRWKDAQGWSKWQYPAYRYLHDRWYKPWSASSEMHDMLQSLADNLYKSVKGSVQPVLDTSVKWDELPAMQAAGRYIGLSSAQRSLAVDSFQVCVWIEKHTLQRDTMMITDSLVVFPKYSWRD